MFGLQKQPKKLKKNVDRLVKGIIIGGAIGSVVGVSLAPKKRQQKKKDGSSKDTRKKNFFTTLSRGLKILITGKK